MPIRSARLPSRSARYGLSAAVLVAAGLALTACGSDDSTSASGPSASASAATNSAPSSTASSSTAPADNGGQGSTDDAAPSASADASTTQDAKPGRSKGSRSAQRDCGPDQRGLEVIVPGSDTPTSCDTARAVANAYGKADGAGGKSAVTVTVAGAAWLCKEEQGGIDPYLACTNTANKAQKVQMSS
ncbi:hypothetical protein [Streptomyces sp. NPDC059398]|uniref:hypothetical protein n=1 Tax=Streptomyces sp. NPDC059398 TaxID=3346820 RepID=UPI0036C6D8E6